MRSEIFFQLTCTRNSSGNQTGPRYFEGFIPCDCELHSLRLRTNVERDARVSSLSGSSSSRSRRIGIRHGTGAGKGEAAGALPHPQNPRVRRREGRDETAEIQLRRGPRGRPPRHHHWSGVPSPVACGRGRFAVDCLVRVAAGPTRPGHTGEIATPRP